jgi:hypothetical protein
MPVNPVTRDANDVFIVTLWVKPGALDKADVQSISQTINGYYRARVFYVPQNQNSAAPDLRSTIHWAPNIATLENGEAEVRFTNAEQPTKIRAVAEGMSENGIPLVGTTEYTVKP